MKYHIRILRCLMLLSVCSVSVIHGQDLTGIWRGHFRSNDGLERVAGNYDDRYKMEVQIAQSHNHFEAVTYSYKSAEFYGKADATGSFNPLTKKVLLREIQLLEVRSAGGVCIMTCFMQYSRLGNDEYLQGTYYSTSAKDSTAGCGSGSIFLHRVLESDFHKEPFLENKEKELARKKENSKIEKPAGPAPATPPVTASLTPPAKKTTTVKSGTTALAPAKKNPVNKTVSPAAPAEQKSTQVVVTDPSRHNRDSTIKANQPLAVTIPFVLKNRTNELLKTITVNSSSIELRIYDDGAIDNDTVSVYYDNKLIISNARLSDQPITVHIDVEPSEHPHQLVMVAENLGDIPPNTSLLVVRDGEKRYEERIISTEQKNVQINFLYKKIE